MAAPAQPATVQTEVVSAGLGAPGPAPQGNALPTQPEPAKRAAHYLWAVLIARIYEVFPLGGPPLWEDCDAQVGEGTQIEPDWDLASQPSPDFDVDQRVNW